MDSAPLQTRAAQDRNIRASKPHGHGSDGAGRLFIIFLRQQRTHCSAPEIGGPRVCRLELPTSLGRLVGSGGSSWSAERACWRRSAVPSRQLERLPLGLGRPRCSNNSGRRSRRRSLIRASRQIHSQNLGDRFRPDFTSILHQPDQAVFRQ